MRWGKETMVREVSVNEMHQKKADAARERSHDGAEGDGDMAGCQ